MENLADNGKGKTGMSFLLLSGNPSVCEPMSWLPHRLGTYPYDYLSRLETCIGDQDALIIDCTDYGGIEVCRHASLAIDPSVVPMFAIGPPSEDVEMRATGAGATGYLIAPISPRQVIARVWQHHNITRRAAFDHLRRPAMTTDPHQTAAQHFPAVRLCAEQHLLVINHMAVNVTPMQVQLLRLLLERAGSIITRNDLHRALWPGDVRTDSALNKHISKVAHLLHQHYPINPIQNLRGVGYKFIGTGEIE